MIESSTLVTSAALSFAFHPPGSQLVLLYLSAEVPTRSYLPADMPAASPQRTEDVVLSAFFLTPFLMPVWSSTASNCPALSRKPLKMDTMVIEDERQNQLVDEADQETEVKGRRGRKKDRKRSKSRVKRTEEEEEENLNNSVSKKQSNISRLAVVKINFLDLCLSTGLTQRMRTESKTTYQRTQTLWRTRRERRKVEQGQSQERSRRIGKRRQKMTLSWVPWKPKTQILPGLSLTETESKAINVIFEGQVNTWLECLFTNLRCWRWTS